MCVCVCVRLGFGRDRLKRGGGGGGLGWGYVGKERPRDKRREWSNTEIVKRQITAPAQHATALHLCCNGSACLRQTAIRASPLATIRSSQGLLPLGPLFRSELPMERANLLVPQCLFLTHSLAPLAVFPDFHPSRACLSLLHLPYRTVCCAVPTPLSQEGHLPGYMPYLSPTCHLLPVTHSCCIFHPVALYSPLTVVVLVSSCLVSSSHTHPMAVSPLCRRLTVEWSPERLG